MRKEHIQLIPINTFEGHLRRAPNVGTHFLHYVAYLKVTRTFSPIFLPGVYPDLFRDSHVLHKNTYQQSTRKCRIM